MTIAETNLESARQVFVDHYNACQKGCKGFDHSGRMMAGLCFKGTKLFHSLCDAEEDYIKKIYRVKVDKAPYRLRLTAREMCLGL